MRVISLVVGSALLSLTSAAPTKREAKAQLPGLPGFDSLPDLPLSDLPVDLPIGGKEKREALDGLPELPDLPIPEVPDLPVGDLLKPLDTVIGSKHKRDILNSRQDLPSILSILSDLSIPLGEPLSELDLSNLYKVLDQFVGSKGAPLPSATK